ncbi:MULTISPECIES: hypothetical protein [Burkholderia]|uniref:Uncharacterized protein n=1 Tax=Burkholderia pyrrocinia TaxID=60550 RepID=A0A318JLK9_BURPY|nr:MULTISPECIES: hypothetical protein [Burkholderia]PXX41132.1 hypothetical protein NA66_1001742 [Burkholderia pyrrocinia]SFW58569.1 hypothetical protein SAMN03159384_03057 [Burkholderia sp. NFACC33-1]SFY12148.1 hypothetical protein SAMN03159408_03269 [Burkholderia sp. NFPP32]
MTEPILSRDQILKIVRKTLKENNDRDKLSTQRFVDLAAAIEAAVLGKVFGEPIYQIGDGNELWRDVEKDDFDLTHHTRIVYALTRSKP